VLPIFVEIFRQPEYDHWTMITDGPNSFSP
jgi:hypothetical protein